MTYVVWYVSLDEYEKKSLLFESCSYVNGQEKLTKDLTEMKESKNTSKSLNIFHNTLP